MPQGQIRKGFFFYFGLFMLLMITVFLICVVIMIFNPGKTVLWMQYFTHNDSVRVTKTTDDNTQINWSAVTDLEINCSYGDVTIERNDNNQYKDGIYIFNKAKGFAVAKKAVKYQYSVQFSEGALTINITEPKGFIYFSKSFKIILHASANGNVDFENMNIKVNTTNGDVNIGGTYFTSQVVTPRTRVKGLEVTTEKGDISFSNNFATESLGKLTLQTTSGRITSSRNVTYDVNSTGTGLALYCDAKFTTKRSTIDIDVLTTTGDVTIVCTKGNVVFDYIKANKITYSNCEQGNYVMSKVVGNCEFMSSDTLMSPNIRIGDLQGNFTLNTNVARSKPDIEIDHISGMLDVTSARGKLDVNRASGIVTVTSSNDMKVDIIVDKDNSNKVTINNGDGDVRLAFMGVIKDARINTKSSEIKVEVTANNDFEARMYKSGTGETDSDLLSKSKITVNIEDKSNENPLVIGNGSVSGKIIIHTDDEVTINLVKASSLGVTE